MLIFPPAENLQACTLIANNPFPRHLLRFLNTHKALNLQFADVD